MQIGKETKKIKMLLPEFNACQSVLSSEDGEPLQLVEALEFTSLFMCWL